MDYKIRFATPDDHDLIYALKSQSVRPYVEKIWGWDEDYQTKDFDSDFSHIEQFNVIEIDGSFVGFVQYYFDYPYFEVVEIHLLPEYRGKGIGSDILRYLQKACIAQDRKIRIGCFKENHRAKALYQKLGFMQTAETDTHYILEYSRLVGGKIMRKFAVILYPNFSLQEITCLTSALTVWFEEKIDFIASENKEYCSEDGLHVVPTKTMADTNITEYDCVILPGTINPLPALYDDRLIDFLKSGINTNVVFAAISSSPLLLAKAGVLKGKKFTAGFFMQMAEVYPFVEKENFIHKGIVCDGNVITGIGMFFREYAEAVLQRFEYDIGNNFMRDKPEDYTEEELTFYWSEEDYREFLEELKEYQP